MRWSARNIILVGLGVGMIASSAAALWLHEQPDTSARLEHQAVDPAMQGTSKDVAALEAEVRRLKGETEDDLTALRSQLAQVDRNQALSGYTLTQLAEKINRVGLEGSAVSAGDEKANAAPLTSEEERERAAAQTQAEIELMEGALHAEQPDPAWANTAQLALNTTFQKEAIPGAQLVDAECHSTLCRMELSLDVSTVQENVRNLFDLAPWSGESFIHIDTETGLAVMYLAREEHALPQLTE